MIHEGISVFYFDRGSGVLDDPGVWTADVRRRERDFGASEMAKIFGKNQAFTATAEVTVLDKQHGTPMTMETQYAFLKGNVRTDLDMATMKGTAMPPQAVAQMKAMYGSHGDDFP